MVKRFRNFWFGQVDTRALSVFRVAFAALLFKDALYHIPLVGVFYSDAGLVPRTVNNASVAVSGFSLLHLMPEAWQAVVVFLLWAGVALCLLVGYRTRLMTILNIILVISIHQRNVFVLTGADTVIRVLSFWMVFVPLNHFYSLDARRRTFSGTSYAFPVRMMQIQVALIYAFTAWLKFDGSLWLNGQAVYYTLQLQPLTLPTGDWLVTHLPSGLFVLPTYFTLLTEIAFPILVFLPFKQPRLRVVGLAMGALLHLGIAVTMSIPDFSLVMITSYLVFFEPAWIIWVDRRLFRGFLSRLGENLSPSLGPHAPAQSGCRGYLGGVGHSVARLYFTGFLALAMLGVLWSEVYGVWFTTPLFAPASSADTGGEVKLSEETAPQRLVVSPPPTALVDLTNYTGLWQWWNMFAPNPLGESVWIAVVGQFANGSRTDLRTGQPEALDDMPRWWVGPDERWKKFDEMISTVRDGQILSAWGNYACHQFADHNPPLIGVEIHQRSRPSHDPDGVEQSVQDLLLWQQVCS